MTPCATEIGEVTGTRAFGWLSFPAGMIRTAPLPRDAATALKL